ncbi:MAG: hypothetical protein WB611_33320 [Stellaceae bacterium]
MTGTVNWSIDVTNSTINDNANTITGPLGNNPTTPVWSNPVAGLTSQSGAAFGSIVDFPLTACRATVNSGTGTIIVNFLQAGLPSR